MPTLDSYLDLERCPHCAVHLPSLITVYGPQQTQDQRGGNIRAWRVYKCNNCGGLVSAFAYTHTNQVTQIFPKSEDADAALPPSVKNYLQQAINCKFAPDGAVLLCGSALDEMLKLKGLTTGRLYDRILQAVQNGLITTEMSAWAHEIRFFTNDIRHADPNNPTYTIEEAEQTIRFTKILGEILFVIPSKITRGRAAVKP